MLFAEIHFQHASLQILCPFLTSRAVQIPQHDDIRFMACVGLSIESGTPATGRAAFNPQRMW